MKNLSKIILIVFLLLVARPAFAWTVLTSDSFDRGNGALTGSTLDNALGGTETNTWTDQNGIWTVTGNAAQATFDGGGSKVSNVNGTADANAQRLTGILKAGGGNLQTGVIARWQTASSGGNGYLLFGADGVIYRKDAGSFTSLANGTDGADGDTIMLTVIDSRLDYTLNGVFNISASDANYSTGKVAIYSSGNVNAPQLNSFKYENYGIETATINNYCYYRAITIDHLKVASSTSATPEKYINFPVLVSATLSSLMATSSGGNVFNTGGYDISFATSTASNTVIKSSELEDYSGTTGRINAWTRLSSISTTTDTVLYMFYNNTTLTSTTDIHDKNNVWDLNYRGVWHLPNGTTLTALDSTIYANNGTPSATSPTAAASQIDGGASFDGNTARNIDVGSDKSLGGLAALTMEGWIKLSAFGDDGYTTIVGAPKQRSGPGDPYQDALLAVSNGTVFLAQSTGNIGSRIFTDQSTTLTTGNWYHVVGTWDGANLKVYKNGVQVGTNVADTNGATPATPSSSFRLGQAGIASSDFEQVNGLLDEVRVSNVARSADWIKTEYNNQNATSTFYTIGNETASGFCAVAATPNTAKIILQGKAILQSQGKL